MHQDFEQRFHNDLDALRALFGKKWVEDRLPRVKEIYEYTEAKWREYADGLPDGVVRYVLIAEAPPWSREGRPKYLLDPASPVETLMREVCKAFHGAPIKSASESLKLLRERGFLLLDSCPFAVPFKLRPKDEKYDELIRLTVKSYLQAKIEDPALTWSPNIRVAFAYKLNALSILKAVKQQLSFGGRAYPISPCLIAADRSGNPHAPKLRSIYGLDHGRSTSGQEGSST